MKPPFPWFGGKSRVSREVWEVLGDVDQYVEPFAGSLGVLLARPAWHVNDLATVNDKDAYLANFWRAVSAAPDEVARYADWPVNETDLFARHLWLVREGRKRIVRLEADPDYYDARVAGWWVWGQCCWIGSGWCSGNGPWTVEDERQLPHLGNAGRGVNRQLPHLGNAGRGVNRQLPHPGLYGGGVAWTGRPQTDIDLVSYMTALAAKLRRVRVCCGDWSRVVTDGALSHGNAIGVFLDPPYAPDVRSEGLYSSEDIDGDLSAKVRTWALEHGDDKRLRIVLAGYAPEHEQHMPPSWRVIAYSGRRAYGGHNTADDSGNAVNRHLERLWFSPSCLTAQRDLFAEAAP